MKKKTLLMSVSALALVCGVASCGHEHEFGSSWQKDETHHWHAAVCEHAEEVADKAAHTWNAGEVTKQATEEAKGEKTFKCTVCDATKTEEIAQLDHTHKYGAEWSNDATHHWHEATCDHTSEVKDKAEHSGGTATCAAKAACEVCGEAYGELAEHSWDAGTVTTQPTYAAAGEKTYECTVCDASKTEAVAKLETKLVLYAADLEVGDIAAGTVVEKDGFKLITDNPDQAAEKIDKSLSVTDDVNVTIGEETFTQRIKTIGSSNTTVGSEERVISFVTSGKGTVKVYAKHGSSDESKPAAKLSVTHVENGVGHDSAEIAVGADAAVYELELHYAGTFYLSSTQNISIYKIEVVWEDGVNDTTWVPALELEDPNVFNVSEFANQTIQKDTPVGNFVINAGTEANDQEVVIDSNSKTFDGVSYTARLKLGGVGTEDYRSVTINVEEASTITIVVCSSNSSNPRTANLFDAQGNAVLATDANVPGSLVGLLFEVTEAGSYNFRVTGGDGGANIYAIYVEAGVAESDPEPTPEPTPTPDPEPTPGTTTVETLDYTALDSALTAATQFGFFTLTTNVKKESVKVAAGVYEPESLTFENQISLTKGKVTTEANGISFTVEAGKTATVTVYAAQKADKTTSLKVLDSTGATVTVTNLTKDGVALDNFDTLSTTAIEKYVFTLGEGTYHLGGAGGGAYVYGISVSFAAAE